MTQPDSSSSARATPAPTAGDNPLGIAGLEFVEFSSPDAEGLAKLLKTLGFVPVAQHVSKAVTLFRQGSMNFLLNAEQDSFASRFAETHGVGIAAIAIRVLDAQVAHERALEYGAWDFEGEKIGPNELAIPAIQGIGDSHIYFVDHWPGKGSDSVASIYDIDFRPIPGASAELAGAGLLEVDHFTQTVGAGRIQEWLDFYREVLHFEEIHQVHPDWHVSQDSAVTISPCGSIRIPVYEEGTYRTDLMQQYLPDHEGEGVQHIALASADIFASVDALMARGVRFLQPPPRYYDEIDARLPGHGLDIERLRTRGILVDGEILPDGTPQLFLQTFVERKPGDMFFEIVERRGHHGFGEGNLSAIARARG
ncbi:4-hydroxyphenylpyruvate dioxygenase [Caballeronia hypogeia]|uniref:4-hydroxyphenylpyruvate dioxygenase n=1 Tax=Caballeronia hypogeia TaxID=1777140 RepID=A0A158B889_9BURK|nr:VOC family protein [Caballeronia hypogeia]SAK66110.1 4-hydroxyphenylpyruvate dioxygenase [Caballeronia hypogeia]